MRFIKRTVSVAVAVLMTASLATTAAFADTNTNTNTQTASNVAVSTQTVAAVSGDAFAMHDSYARSGDAYAKASSTQAQLNVQIAANQVSFGNHDPANNTNRNRQTADNAAGSDQAAAAVSGQADAIKDSASKTGDAWASAKSKQLQANIQVGLNQSRLR